MGIKKSSLNTYNFSIVAFALLLMLAIGMPVAYGQTTQRNVLRSLTEAKILATLPAPGKWHPFPQKPEEWKQQYPANLLQRMVKDGEAALKEDYPVVTATMSLDYVRTGDSKARYEKLFFRKREILWTLALAESVEGKGRFTDKVMDGIWSVCEETFWGSTSILHMQKAGTGLPDAEEPVVDLYAAETAAQLAWIDYFNGDALDKNSKMVRKRLRYEVNRRVFTPLLTAQYFYMTSAKPNNWAPWIMSNYINAQLLLETDVTKRSKAINYGLRLTDKYINGLGADGSVDEGPGYWSQAVGCVYDELNLLYEASNGKLNVFNDPYVQKMGVYIYRMHIGGQNYINVGDAVPHSTPSALLLFRYGQSTGDKTMMNFASWLYHKYNDAQKAPYINNSRNSRSRSLYNMAAIKACEAYPFKEPHIEDAWASDIEIMSSRSANNMFVAAYGGHNGKSHNHNDVGNVLVYADDEPVIIDLGPGAYTSNTFSDKRYTLWFNTSPYHNIPTVNGLGEAAGANYGATNVKYVKGDTQSSITMNLAKAYPVEAGVKRWDRTVSMDKVNGIASVIDNYEVTAPVKSITQTFMTVCTTETGTPGKVVFNMPGNKKVVMDYDAAISEVVKEKMNLESPEAKKFKETWKGMDIWRILLVNKAKLPAATVAYSFHK
ncbi:heparinase II/III family protein [Mucilaginibacter terrae]|uniref:heparinase II/III domain-containing protein n=1 Tax=Mucilaginibacter terrae TaxID=1955052 RepID=UPI00363D919C